MSFFQTQQTDMTDRECVIGSLGEQLPQKGLEVLSVPRKLQGYGRGEADIIIKRGTIGNHYEMGFAKQANGNFALIAADDDTHKLDLKAVKRGYSEQKAINMAKARGMKFIRKDKTVGADKKVNIKLIFQAAAMGV